MLFGPSMNALWKINSQSVEGLQGLGKVFINTVGSPLHERSTMVLSIFHSEVTVICHHGGLPRQVLLQCINGHQEFETVLDMLTSWLSYNYDCDKVMGTVCVFYPLQ